MHNELVSIIVPAYQHESYIPGCLRSIYEQSHERIEIIFIDDCSVDATFEIGSALFATPFRRRFENVILQRKEMNAGAHDSLNRGLALAKGDYIAILNSDDEYEPTRISQLLTAMKAEGTEFAFSLIDVISDDKPRLKKDDFFRFLAVKVLAQVDRYPTIGFSLLDNNISMSTGNFVFSRGLGEKVGKFLPLRFCHDWDFILQALIFVEPALVRQPLYRYRIHETNSFRDLGHVAKLETEVVFRRFFRRILSGTPNSLCPSPRNWPGYFETFLTNFNLYDFWNRELGNGLPGWRTLDRIELEREPIWSSEHSVRDILRP